MDIDHVVVWVTDPKTALAFYVDVVGLEPVREAEFEAGQASFPSVRVNAAAILDLMAKCSAPGVRGLTDGGDGAGRPLNHLCLSLTADEYARALERLQDRGLDFVPGGDGPYGAQGYATESGYFHDPDGNVIELRYYGARLES